MGFWNKLFGQSRAKQPEDEFTITITVELVKVEHPKRKTEQVLWKDIKEIRFVNTDGGPAPIDIWMMLIGEHGGCLLPHGTEGCKKVYEIVSKYPGFNFENVIKSMGCSENAQFVVWKKEEAIKA